MKITIEERVLHFKQPAGTSRGVYTERRSWFVNMSDGVAVGIGECAPLPQLSCDDIPNYGEVLRRFCDDVERTGEIDYEVLRDYPSMLFGLETAMLNLQNGERLFDTAFSRGDVGIPINGLVWMGTFEEMQQRIEEKLAKGFRCVKLKIGAIDFDAELELIKKIRSRFSYHDVELRVDANGAFPYEEALYELELLSQYALHFLLFFIFYFFFFFFLIFFIFIFFIFIFFFFIFFFFIFFFIFIIEWRTFFYDLLNIIFIYIYIKKVIF